MCISAHYKQHIDDMRRFARGVFASVSVADDAVAKALISYGERAPEKYSGPPDKCELFRCLIEQLLKEQDPLYFDQDLFMAPLHTLSRRERIAFLLVTMESYTLEEAASLMAPGAFVNRKDFVLNAKPRIVYSKAE